jgi:type I restriction enzyme M protein
MPDDQLHLAGIDESVTNVHTSDVASESDLIGISDIARLADVKRTIVANWRTRHRDFPSSAAEPASGPVFRRDEVSRWLEQHRPGSARIKPLGFEAKLWQAADALRNSMDAAEYKHVVLGLIFLKHISDSFEERRAALEGQTRDPGSESFCATEEERQAALEDRDEYTAENVFWVPAEARWSRLSEGAKRPEIGRLVDDAMGAIERDNSRLHGVLPRDYARPTLDWHSLGQLIDLVGGIGLGGAEARARDVLGRVYEYFLGRFASVEGKGGGEFYTPPHVVRLLVEMLEPYDGRVYDPCCGSGGMFVQSVKFLEAHGGRRNRLSIYGQESNPTTWRLCQMNLAIRGIDANIGPEPADTFRRDLHSDLRADYILANPPFNVSDWKGDLLRDDVRWRYGRPPVGNANFAWIQHFIHHLSPHGMAGFVLSNGSLSSQQSGEGEIRRAIVEADLVDCVVALPPQLFFTTQIPACLWFIARDKSAATGLRDRRGEVLFIDARSMGQLVTRVHRVLTDEEIQRIAERYHAWRGEEEAGEYEDEAGFCRVASVAELGDAYALTPGRYVADVVQSVEDEPIEMRVRRLSQVLMGQMAESEQLAAQVQANLRRLVNG